MSLYRYKKKDPCLYVPHSKPIVLFKWIIFCFPRWKLIAARSAPAGRRVLPLASCRSNLSCVTEPQIVGAGSSKRDGEIEVIILK